MSESNNEAGYQHYVGLKIIKAKPRLAAEEDRRGIHPVGAPGYEVMYEDGYISWSPKKVFESAYRPAHGMGFIQALELMRHGGRVTEPSFDFVAWIQLMNWDESSQSYQEIDAIDFSHVKVCTHFVGFVKKPDGTLVANPVRMSISDKQLLSNSWAVYEETAVPA